MNRLPRILALVGAELRAALRDTSTTASLLLFTAVVGFVGPAGEAVIAHLQALKAEAAAEQDSDDNRTHWSCEPGVMLTVAAVGDVPGWLSWPDPLVEPEAADVLLRFGPEPADGEQEIELVQLSKAGGFPSVKDCLSLRLRQERRRRLASLGVTEEPFSVVSVDAPTVPDDGVRPSPPIPLGATLAGGLAVLLVSSFMETGPRARAAGWLETWMILPGRRSDLVVAWWLYGLVMGAIGLPLLLLGDALGHAVVGGSPSAAVPWGLLPVLVMLMSAVGVRAFLDVADVRAALVRTVPVLLLIFASVGAALLVEQRWPGLGCLVPIGGLGLVLAGQASGALLTGGVSLLLTALVLANSSRHLDHLAVTRGAMSSTAARRARGDYLPEALLLVLVGVGGSTSWAPPELLLPDVVVRTGLGLTLFFLLPAVFVSVPLRLDRRRLLSWRPPPLRAWAFLPLVVGGTLSGGFLLWKAAQEVLPDTGLVDAYTDTMASFDTPLGLFVVSVIPAFAEELLFRGAVLGLLRKRLPAWAAVLLQALAFALLHGMAARLPYTLLLGALFGLMVVRTGSLWPGIVAHLAHNLLSTQLDERFVLAVLASPLAPAMAVIGVVAVWAAGGWRLRPMRGFSRSAG